MAVYHINDPQGICKEEGNMAIKQTRRANEQEEAGAVMKMNELSDEVAEKKGSRSWMQWITRVGRRNWIIIGALVLIGMAVWLNWMFFADSAQAGYADYDSSAGMTDGAGDQSSGESVADYFATVEVNRKRARDESMEVLQSVIDNPDATETVKNEALAEMNAIANEIEKEANIEALLVSKGFEDCVAVMNGNQINVVVKSQGELQTAQIAQINAVVYEQTGIEPINVTIVHKN
jgi:hypothetical protein